MDFAPIGAWHIHKHDTVMLISRTFIKLYDPTFGRKLDVVYIEFEEKILKLKEKVHEQYDSWPVETIRFLTNDTMFGDDDDVTLEECGLNSGVMLDVVKKLDDSEFTSVFFFVYFDW